MSLKYINISVQSVTEAKRKMKFGCSIKGCFEKKIKNLSLEHFLL